MRLAVTYNLSGQGGGLDLAGVEEVCAALLESHEEAEPVEAGPGAVERLRSIRPDMVFNMAEGAAGESREAQMPAVLEMLGIPYTGSGPLSMALCMNKARAKEMLSHYGIPTARFIVARSAVAGIDRFLTFPMMVKPLDGTSSSGIENDSIVRGPEELESKVASVLKERGQSVLIEEYLEGREFMVVLLGNGENLKALPIVEIDCRALPEGVSPIYSRDARLLLSGPGVETDILRCPADIGPRLSSAISDVATDAFRALDVRDWCRVDVRLDSSGVPHVIELNPLPGPLGKASGLIRAAAAGSMDLSALVGGVVEIARERYGL